MVGEAVAASSDQPITLVAGGTVSPRERVTASQATAADHGDPLPPEQGVEVLATPTVAELGSVSVPETLLECATCLWVKGVDPGAEVTVDLGSGTTLTAGATGAFAYFALPPGEELSVGEGLSASQAACGLSAGPVPLQAAVGRGSEPLGPPTVGPLARCQQRIAVGDVRPGATVVATINDEPEDSTCFAWTSGTLVLHRPLDLHDRVGVRQEFFYCELRSAVRTVTVELDKPPRPGIAGPVCEGDRLVRVAGVLSGATVEFKTDGGLTWQSGAGDGALPFGVPSLIGAGALSVRQSVCPVGDDAWSDWSDAVAVRALGPQSEPGVVAPIFAGGVAVGVKGVARGTFVQIVGRRGVIGEGWGNGDERLDVLLDFPLEERDRIHVRTRRCGAERDWPTQTQVQGFHDPGLPVVADPACDCGGSVLVRNALPGAVVEVYVARPGGLSLLGTTAAGAAEVSVDVRPLVPGEVLQAAQRIAHLRSAVGAGATAPAAPHWQYVPNSAFRLCQLTSNYHPSDRPQAADTSGIGLIGTDLGIPVEHGVMYLFFGDCASGGGVEQDADPIAWCTTVDPYDLEDAAPDMHWAVGADGKFRRLAVNDLPPLGNFEVPTGGFSYDGKIYVFVGTHGRVAPSDEPPQPMTESHLGGAPDPGHNFTLLQDISSSVGADLLTLEPDPDNPGGLIRGTAPYPARRWMVHISATVVDNAAWPGLPAAVGQGLLMFGSSVYRGNPLCGPLTAAENASSNVYLAWAPLTPGTTPPAAPIPAPDQWKFFTGFTGGGQPQFASLASGATPHPLLPPDPGPGGVSVPRLLGELSAVWHPQLRRWVLTGTATGDDRQLQLARMPWGPWTTSDSICDPARPDRDAGNSDPARHWNDTNIVYAPYLTRRWIRWDRSVRKATLYYTLSVFDLPNNQARYQPQLMRSDILCLP